MCWVSWHSKHVICFKITRNKFSSLKRCHGNSIIDINIPFTVLHRPCVDIILMKFEANRLKIRCWIQSILKMTHFLLPVGGAITLTPNSHISALGIIQRTKPWSLIKIRQCMWMLLGASCLSFFAINSSPRHGQNRSRYQKYPGNFASPMSWDHVHRVWWQSGGDLQRSISNSRAWFFKQPWIADFLLGGAYDMQCEICSAQWDLYVYRVLYEYVQACVSYTSSFQTVF